jgi:Peptidase family M50
VARGQPYLGIGRTLAVIITCGGLFALELLWIHSVGMPHSLTKLGLDIVLGILIVYLTAMVALAIHELGHYLAARLLRSPVRAIQIGAPPALASFRIGGTRVDVGPRISGRVQWDHEPSAGRRWIVTLAGPLANLVTAPLPLVLPLPSATRYAAALIFAVAGASNLLPFRLAPGKTNDGLMLLTLRARSKCQRELQALLQDPDWSSRPETADIVVRGCRLDIQAALARRFAAAPHLRQAGRTRELLWLHQLPLDLPDSPPPNHVGVLHHMEWQVVALPDVPLADANLAGWRMAWVLKHSTPEDQAAAWHTLAVVRLRQSLYGEVEPLCADALAAKLEPSQRACVLATVAIARQALGTSGREALDEALSLDPDADLVAEAVRRVKQRPRARQPAGRPTRRQQPAKSRRVSR